MRSLKISLLVFILSITISAQWYQQNSGTNESFYGVEFTDSLNGTVVGGNGIIVRTTDGGESWINQLSGTNLVLWGVSFFDNNNGTVVGEDGTILRSTDGGQSWISQTSGTGFDLLGVYMIDESNVIIVGYFGTILKTVDGGETWIPKSSGTGKHIYSVSFINTNNGVAVGGIFEESGIILKTTDGGETWVTKLEISPETLYGVSFVDQNIGTTVGGFVYPYPLIETKIILRTIDGGENWTTQLFETTSPFRGISCTDSNNGIAVGRNGIIFRTTDGGLDWISQTSTTDNTLIAVSFTDANNGWAVGWNGTILHTSNGGTPVELISFTAEVFESKVNINWTTATEINNSGFEIFRRIYPEGNRRTQNENDVWDKIGFIPGHGTTTETQHYSFTDNDIKPGKYQYKLKQIDYDGSFEYSQIVEVEVPLVNEFSLSQNYPNPFNPVTQIKYSIPTVTLRQAQSDIKVTLKVYDLLGREVATLVNEEKPAGEYEVEFNATNLPSGIYFYQLTAGEFSETRKMILLK